MKKANFKNIVITGASSGIGENLAITLAERFTSLHLVLAARNFAKLQEIKKKLLKLPHQPKVEIIKCDIASKMAVKKLMQKTYQVFERIDVLVLNAGISMWQSFEDIKEIDILEKIMRTNYLGVVYPLHFAWGNIVKDQTRVIVVSSAQSFIPLPFHSGYVASKYAVNGFLDVLRQEQRQQKVSIAEIMLGWVRGTSLRENALGDAKNRDAKNTSQKKSKGKKSSFAVDVTECTDIIIEAFSSNKEVIYAPHLIRFIPWLKVLSPGILYWLIRKVTGKEGK